MNTNDTVMLSRAEEYDAAKIKDILRVHFAALGVSAEFFAGKKVAIKQIVHRKPRLGDFSLLLSYHTFKSYAISIIFLIRNLHFETLTKRENHSIIGTIMG